MYFGPYFILLPHYMTTKTKICRKCRQRPEIILPFIMSEDHMMYGSWDIKCDEQMRWKNEKNSQRYYHFTLVYQKIWSNDVRVLKYQVRQTEVFVNLGYFLPFYPTNNLKNQNFEKIKVAWRYHHFQMKIIWYMVLEIWSVTDRSFCHFGLLFALLPLPPNPMNKTPTDIIILHMWTRNENHMMYDTWDMEWDTQIFFSHFGQFLLPFYSSNNPQNQNF